MTSFKRKATFLAVVSLFSIVGSVSAQGRLSYGLGASSADIEALLNAQRGSNASTYVEPQLDGQISPDIDDLPLYDPVASDAYGQWLFAGHFARQSFTGFNPGYVLAIGDRVDLRFWGGFDYQALLTIDTQGKVFVPRIGPITLAGVKNEDLNRVVRARLSSVFREEVGVYASLAAAQPVKVFVGGGVVRPGLYGATSSDSLLHFLDRAGGIEPEAGSYRRVEVLRDGRRIRAIDLYKFLTEGQLPLIQLRDGDTIFVKPRGAVVQVEGLVAWPKRFEYGEDSSLLALLELAQVRPEATHVRITRQSGLRRETLVFPLNELESKVSIEPGDVVDVYADRPYATVLVRVDGEHQGSSQLVLPYGASLQDALKLVSPTAMSDTQNVRLYRRSLAERQKVMIDQLLSKLEESVLTARSKTAQEAALRAQESQLILQFVDRARGIEPKGQVILSGSNAPAIILEEGDKLEVPRRTQLVGVHGEVYLPAAFSWKKNQSVGEYIRAAGGFTQSGARDRVLLMRPNGAVQFAKVGGWFGGVDVDAGDEILVLPRVDEKGFQFTKDVVEVIYQIAVAAGVLVRL